MGCQNHQVVPARSVPRLAAAALEPNVFYEPWMLLPALKAHGASRHIGIALSTRLILVPIQNAAPKQGSARKSG
jgi:hypothetical protein